VYVTVVSAQVNSDRESYIFHFIPRQWTNVCSGIFIFANERLQTSTMRRKERGGVYRHNKSQFIGSELNNLSVTPLYSS